MIAGLDEATVKTRLLAGVSRSLTRKGIGALAISSSITKSAMGERTGLARTVTANVRDMVSFPSCVDTLMFTKPFVPGAGMKVRLPVEPGLAYVMTGSGMISPLLDRAAIATI